jgi:hypothetical protein
MKTSKINIESVQKYFRVGDVIESGGGKAKIRIKEIFDNGIRFQSVTSTSYKGILRYEKLNVVLNNFDKIPQDSITHHVFQLLIKNGLFDSTHETNLYGFVKEFIKRSKK